MTGQHSHGGKREGAGRPPEYDHPRQQLIIRASDEELQRILDTFSTRERTQALLEVADRLRNLIDNAKNTSN